MSALSKSVGPTSSTTLSAARTLPSRYARTIRLPAAYARVGPLASRAANARVSASSASSGTMRFTMFHHADVGASREDLAFSPNHQGSERGLLCRRHGASQVFHERLAEQVQGGIRQREYPESARSLEAHLFIHHCLLQSTAPTTRPIPLGQRDGLRSDGGGLRRPRLSDRFVRRSASPVPRSAAAQWWPRRLPWLGAIVRRGRSRSPGRASRSSP